MITLHIDNTQCTLLHLALDGLEDMMSVYPGEYTSTEKEYVRTMKKELEKVITDE